MAEGLLVAAKRFRDALDGFDANLLSALDCEAAVNALVITEKACAAARARAAARAVDQGAHKAGGFTSGAEWLARQMGATIGEARMALETASGLESCPQVSDAIDAGQMSLAQAHEIVRAAKDDPDGEGELVDLARRSGLNTVRDAARQRVLNRADPEELHRRQHRQRELKHWQDRDGMICGSFKLTPDIGVPIVNRLDIEVDRLRRQTGSCDETLVALGADALAGALSGSGRRGSNRVDMVIVCDLNAYRRGHTHEGEPCRIVGAGPIPVAVARQLAQDAFLKAVIHDGVQVHTVKHFGRYIPTELRTALELGAPPAFPGVHCELVADCTRRYNLQWDHTDPVAHGGQTSLANLKPGCTPHHRDKTEQDRQAGLLDTHREEARDVRLL